MNRYGVNCYGHTLFEAAMPAFVRIDWLIENMARVTQTPGPEYNQCCLIIDDSRMIIEWIELIW
jgi:hypothetical protein